MGKRTSLKFFVGLFVLAISMCICTTTAYAKTTTKNLTLIRGEEATYNFTGIGALTRVTSSAPKIVKVEKVLINGNTCARISAKRKGTATVKCKGDSGNTMCFKITVKNPSYGVSVKEVKGRAVITFKNKLSFAYLDRVDITATFRDAKGNTVEEQTVFLHAVGPNKTACEDVSVVNLDKIDFNQTSFSVSESRSLNTNCAYKDVTKNVKFAAKKVGDNLKVTVRMPELDSGSVDAAYSLFFYDEQGKMVSIIDGYEYLYSAKPSHSTRWSIPANAKSWEIKYKRAYMKYTK